MRASLVTDTLKQAITSRKINTNIQTGLLFHSDQGSQYTSADVQNYLENNKRANCWDNAVAESFFKSLKTELLTNQTWSSQRMQQELFEYIDIDYNSKRYHSSLGYKTPNYFEQNRV